MSILALLSGSTLYIQISPTSLRVRDPESGRQFVDVPEVAIVHNPKARIVGIGSEARLRSADSAVQVVNPFAHPRTLVSDFAVAEQLLKAAISRVKRKSFLSAAPRVVMHPVGDPAGGYTLIEIRALREMALGAGASQVYVWQGRDLTDQELLSGTFPTDGKVLD